MAVFTDYGVVAELITLYLSISLFENVTLN